MLQTKGKQKKNSVNKEKHKNMVCGLSTYSHNTSSGCCTGTLQTPADRLRERAFLQNPGGFSCRTKLKQNTTMLTTAPIPNIPATMNRSFSPNTTASVTLAAQIPIVVQTQQPPRQTVDRRDSWWCFLERRNAG